MPCPRLEWDIGTAYDLFVSLKVVHQPLAYGLRASWAAGVRSRLPLDLRETLDLFSTAVQLPMHWVHNLPKPKSGAVVIDQLSKLHAPERLPVLAFNPVFKSPVSDILLAAKKGKKWTDSEAKVLRDSTWGSQHMPTSEYLELLHKFWSRKDEMGEKILPALKAYQENFFFEEEERILPALKIGQAHAQKRSGCVAVKALLEELSEGVRFEELINIPDLILVPSFWSAPFVFYDRIDGHTNMMLYGSRPAAFALIPGEVIPDSLVRGLKALADPTRLQILRNLAAGPQTPTQLARDLRLRTPTVTHHMFELRLAGLVQVTLSSEGERLYSTRLEGIISTHETLEKFINGE